MIKKRLNQLLSLSVLTIATISSAYAAADNFNCPQSSEIQSTDFTSPSIWVAPPVQHAAPGTVGVGLGGKKVKEFLGAEAAEVNHKPGWVCVYRSSGGLSVSEYKSKIKNTIESTQYLRKFLDKMNEQFEKAEPYLKKYPKNVPLGFVGYQKEAEFSKK